MTLLRSISFGTEYTEGDTDASITGTAVLWEDTGNTLRPASSATPFPVNIVSGGGSGTSTEYVEDAATVANPQGGQLMLRRRDTLTVSEVSADSDVIAANATAKGEIYVKHTDTITVDTELTTANLDSGAGTDTRAVVGLLGRASGGAVLIPGDATFGIAADVKRSALPSGAATEATLGLVLTQADFDTKTGSLTESAPGTDTASSGLNGRLQRIAQRLTTLIAFFVNGSGTAASAIRVELPTNGTGVIATVGAVTAITNALPAGTNAIGKLAANSGVTIGAVEIAAAQTLANVTTVGTITNNVNTVEVAPTTVLNGKTTVTTAGSRVALAASTSCKSVTIKALAANTGTIYVGSSTVASTNGYQLAAGDTVSLDISNLNTVNIDSSVDGEGVTYLGVN